MQVSKKALGKH